MVRAYKRFIINILIIALFTAECAEVSEVNNLANCTTPVIPQEETTFMVTTIINDKKVKFRQKTHTPIIANKEDEEDYESDEIADDSHRHRGKIHSSRINRQGPKIWDQWGNWSRCSVTCGIGKLTRWRHCIGGSCLPGEKKAQLKTCTFAAC